jgi:hypothetical protein
VIAPKDDQRSFYFVDPTTGATQWSKQRAGSPLLVLAVRMDHGFANLGEFEMDLLELGTDPPRKIWHANNDYGIPRFFDLLK